jgi:hypothetical protein
VARTHILSLCLSLCLSVFSVSLSANPIPSSFPSSTSPSLPLPSLHPAVPVKWGNTSKAPNGNKKIEKKQYQGSPHLLSAALQSLRSDPGLQVRVDINRKKRKGYKNKKMKKKNIISAELR